MPDLQRNMRRTAQVLFAGFVVIALTLGYWQILRAADLGASPDNPRVANARLDQPRGRILDRAGQVLASSTETPNGMQRRYADPSMVHTIGFHSARFGDTNLEAAYGAQLSGDRSPSPTERLADELFHKQPQPSDLVLTVDRRINDAAVAAMGDASGSIVAIDPRTGAVLAMVSTPYFDPNQPDDKLAQLQDDRSRPLFNRSIQATLVPGSTFKTVTASAAVDLGLVNLDEPFSCTRAVVVQGYSVDCRNSQHVPVLTYKQAYAWSSNRVFGLTAMLLGFSGPMNPWLSDSPPGPYPWDRPGASIEASAQRLEEYAQRFGFTKSIPFDLPVAPSQVRDPQTKWTPQLLVQTGFGQGQIAATPMQMALVAAAVANGGRVPRPYLVSEVRSPDGSVDHPNQPGESFSQAMSSKTAQTLVSFMVEGTVRGYAEPAAIPGVQVGGKTGTAEVGDGTSHSWFIGFAPADDPRVAVAVVMEHKGSGSEFATPAGRKVMQAALDAYKR